MRMAYGRSMLARGLTAVLGVLWFSGLAAAADEVLIGTAESDSVHHHVGRAICHLINHHADDIRCEARPATDSLSNLENVRNGAIEAGVALSDWQYHAVNRTGPVRFMDGSFENIRALFSVHAEPLTVVAKRGSGLKSLDDLKGSRINIGNAGSVERAAMDALMDAAGWTDEDFQLVQVLPADQQSLAFCHDRLQAMVFRVVHPDAVLQQADEMCEATLVDLGGPVIEKLVGANPHYTAVVVPAGVYSGTPKQIKSFGVVATLVTSEDISEDVVYRMTKAVFENLEALRKTHPSLRSLEASQMMRNGLSAPLHPGAVRYFRESGNM